MATKTIAATDNVNEILFLLFLSLLMLFIVLIVYRIFRKSQQLFSKSCDFDSHRRKLVTSFCPLFFILNQLSHRLEHNLAVDHLMKPSVILKFHRGNRLTGFTWMRQQNSLSFPPDKLQ